MSDRKELTDYAVHQTAYDCCQTRGVTTSLEVKNELREQGFEAIQTEVSEVLQTIVRTTTATSAFIYVVGLRRCLYFVEQPPLRIPTYESTDKGTVMIAQMNRFWLAAAICKLLRAWAKELSNLDLVELQDQIVCSGLLAEIAPDNLELQDLASAFGQETL